MMTNFLILTLGLYIFPTIISTAYIGSNPSFGQHSKSYEGFSLIRTNKIQSDDVVRSVWNLHELDGVKFWSLPHINQSIDILVSPKQSQSVSTFLTRKGLSYEILIKNVETLRQSELTADEGTRLGKSTGESMNWDTFHRYNEILNWAKQWMTKDPKRVHVRSIGKSVEGREIILMKIASSVKSNGTKPAIFLDGGMHGREWISPSTVTYIAQRLLVSKKYHDLIETFDWYIVPVVNVDGYEYTHEVDRFWRKNRSKRPITGLTNGLNSDQCVGVDLNRNWNFHWREPVSNLADLENPCSDWYSGPTSFSEPETVALSKTILEIRDQLKMYISLHSYSQMWLIPFGYNEKAKVSDYSELYRLGLIGKETLEKTYGSRYQIGTVPHLLYEAPGSSDDWTKGEAKIPYAYTIELRDTGHYAFALPPSEIVPTAEETLNGVFASVRSLAIKIRITKKKLLG